MSARGYSGLMLGSVILLLCVGISYSAEQVVVEFLYWDPRADPRFCGTCPSWTAFYQDFLSKNETMIRIRGDYGEGVVFVWVNVASESGACNNTMLQLYNVSSPNALVINGEVGIEGNFNETYIRETIDAALEGLSPPNQSFPLLPAIVLAFSFGFFETFSPCLIVMLSFILSYTVGKTTRFKENLLQVMAFGTGFLAAALSIGVAFALVFLSLQAFQVALTWIICIFVLFLGFSMLGLFKMPIETKPLLQKISKKHIYTYAGLIVLGYLFYFLDPCIAPVLIAMLPTLSFEALPIILLVFSVGVLLPFFFFGFLAGSISKLVRTTYKHKSKIHAFSGLIVISYALYLIFFYLL